MDAVVDQGEEEGGIAVEGRDRRRGSGGRGGDVVPLGRRRWDCMSAVGGRPEFWMPRGWKMYCSMWVFRGIPEMVEMMWPR